jgi:hypothetical protein
MGSQNLPAHTAVSLKLGEKTIVITPADADRIRVAFVGYLRESRSQLAETVPGDLMPLLENSVGDPWVDPTGHLRMGTWILEAKQNEPVLTFRPVPPGSFQFVARLTRADAEWRVLGVSVNPILVRR